MMPLQRKRQRGCSTKKNMRVLIGSDLSDPEPASSTESSHHISTIGYNPRKQTKPLFSKLKIRKNDQKLLPRMTIDGTCAPPRVISMDNNFHCLIQTSPTTPPKHFQPRMSIGGRAPPKLTTPPKDFRSSSEQGITSRPVISQAAPENPTETKQQGTPRRSVRRVLISCEVAVQKPQGKPIKVERLVDRSRKNPLNKPQCVSEFTTKESRGRPRKSLASGSKGIAECSTKEPQGRPKGSVKRPGRIPATRKGQAHTASVSHTLWVLIDRYTPKTVSAAEGKNSVKQALVKSSNIKQHQPAGCTRKSVNDNSSNKKGERKSQIFTTVESSKVSSRQINTRSKC